jgi:hypothetical protein
MIEVLKQAAEDVSKAYDVLAFAHTERALELLAKTRTSLRQAIAGLESQEPVAWMKPDVLCDRACMYLCTKGFTQFPECATAHPSQRTEQEPVAILNHAHGVHTFRNVNLKGLPDGEYLVYTHPSQRTWVGLTDDEHCNIWYKESLDWMEYGKAIEAKLKQKNGFAEEKNT